MGFCLFNNIAVGVAHALAKHGLTRAAVIDFDVHHGNGTEDIFAGDENVIMADAMYAPVATRFVTYDIKLDRVCSRYCRTILALPEMKQWTAAARKEPDEIDELEVEF